MGSVCCPTIASKQPRRSSSKPSAVGAIRRQPSLVQPTTEREHLACEQKKMIEDQFQRRMKQANVKPRKPTTDGPFENNNLINMNTEQTGTTKKSQSTNKCFSRNTTVITKSMKLQRTVSYLNQKQDFKSFLSQAPSTQRIQQVLVVPRKLITSDSEVALKNKFYSLIAEKAFVRKPLRGNFKVNSPCGRIEVVCHPQLIKQTIFVTQGIPIQNIKLLNTGPDSVSFITQPNFELEINLTLRCRQCQKITKQEFSVACIRLDFICQCGCKDFDMIKIGSANKVPLWMDAKKIQGPVEYVKGKQIQAFGCTDCWCFKQCQTLPCGCWKCKNCFANSRSQCMFCETH